MSDGYSKIRKGALGIKLQKSKKKKKKKVASVEETRKRSKSKRPTPVDDEYVGMTASERAFHEKRRAKEELEVAETAALSHKERIEAYNAHLGSLTEKNDMPRVDPRGGV